MLNRGHVHKIAGVLVMMFAAVTTIGCAQRTIEITSDPSGALVHLNDQEVGRTPVEVPFTFYGTYSVRLERDGYHPLWTEREADAPWWELPGPDLIAEAVGAESHLHWHFDLKDAPPASEVNEQRLLEHARQMRARVRQESAEDMRE